jgi:hypothetical protein
VIDQKPPLVRMKRSALRNLLDLINPSSQKARLTACSRGVMDMSEAASIQDEALGLIEEGIKSLPNE